MSGGIRNLLVCLALVLVSCGRVGESPSVSQDVELLIEQSERMLDEEDVDSAWTLLEQACGKAEAAGASEVMARVYLAMAQHHNMMARPDSALSCLLRCVPLMPDSTGKVPESVSGRLQDPLLAQIYGEMSATYNMMGDMPSCVRWARKALPLMLRYGSNEDYAILCGNTGIAYRRIGMNDSAAVVYQKGLEVAVASGDHDSEAYLANNLSVLYADMGRISESILYAEKAETAATLAGDDIEKLSAQAAKGIALLLDKKTDEAVAILKPAFQQADSTSSVPLKLKVTNYLLKALTASSRWSEVEYYLGRGEEIAATLPPGNISAAGILEAKMLLQTEKGEYAAALSTLDSIEAICTVQQVMPPYKILSQRAICMAGLGNHKEAYELQSRAAALSDSIRNEESSAKLDQLTTSYRVMEKELEVSRLNQKQAESQRKISVLVAVSAVLLAVLAMLALWMRNRHREARMRETRKYVEGVEQERSRFARELHDGACNELLAIGMRLRSRPDDDFAVGINNQVSTLRAYLRNLSHELMPPQFTDGVRLDEASSYYLSHLDNQQLHFSAEGSSWEQIPPDVSYQVYRILQEAIGNIIVHQPDADVNVTLSYNGKEKESRGARQLELHIESVGETREGDGTGVGLQSINDRAASIGAHIDVDCTSDKFSLSLRSLI